MFLRYYWKRLVSEILGFCQDFKAILIPKSEGGPQSIHRKEKGTRPVIGRDSWKINKESIEKLLTVTI